MLDRHKSRIDVGEAGPYSFRTNYEALRDTYTAWKLTVAEKKGKIITVPEIHEEFEQRINAHLLNKGHLSNFEFDKKSTKN